LTEIPCPFNLWMNTPPRSDGSIAWLAPESRPGDFIRLQAEEDAILVLYCCPMDLSPINGDAKNPTSPQVHIEDGRHRTRSLHAEEDAILVLSCCPMDLSPINGDAKNPTSLQVIIEA